MANYSLRMEDALKAECEELFAKLGLNMSTAITVFLRQCLRVGGLPFEVRIDQPNKETIAALEEAERIIQDPSAKRYSDVEDALEELKK